MEVWERDGSIQVTLCRSLNMLYRHFIYLFIYLFIYKDFIYLERGEGREKERERNTDLWEMHQSVAFDTPPTGIPAHNPGMCPDLEWNLWPFGLQAGIHSTEPHQPGLIDFFIHSFKHMLVMPAMWQSVPKDRASNWIYTYPCLHEAYRERIRALAV